MRFKDLREFVSFLEERGELKRVTAPVNSELEITEITDRMVKSGGPALLFENVDGGTTPLLINIFGTHRRTALALGVEDIEELADRVRELFKMVQGPPSGLGGKLHALGELMGLARSQPKTVRRAPCQEVALTGDEVDLYKMPIIKCWPMDAGPFITLPLVISRDPVSGRRNVGTYRMQVYDRRRRACTGRRTRWGRVTTAGRGNRDWTAWKWRSRWEPTRRRCGRGRCPCRPTWTSWRCRG